jgi:hypothetical protein
MLKQTRRQWNSKNWRTLRTQCAARLTVIQPTDGPDLTTYLIRGLLFAYTGSCDLMDGNGLAALDHFGASRTEFRNYLHFDLFQTVALLGLAGANICILDWPGALSLCQEGITLLSKPGSPDTPTEGRLRSAFEDLQERGVHIIG